MLFWELDAKVPNHQWFRADSGYVSMSTYTGVEELGNVTRTGTLPVLLTIISEQLPHYLAHKYLWSKRIHSQTRNIYMLMFIILESLQLVPCNLALNYIQYDDIL